MDIPGWAGSAILAVVGCAITVWVFRATAGIRIASLEAASKDHTAAIATAAKGPATATAIAEVEGRVGAAERRVEEHERAIVLLNERVANALARITAIEDARTRDLEDRVRRAGAPPP